MAEAKRAKYFCEGCGSEVAPNAKVCPICGKFFAAVRCPNCGRVGTVRDFLKGCPSCHYAMTQDDIFGINKEHNYKKKSVSPKKIKKRHISLSLGEDVPVWLFILSVIALISIFTFLFVGYQF